MQQTDEALKERPADRNHYSRWWTVQQDRLLLAAFWRGTAQRSITIPGKSNEAARLQLRKLKAHLPNDLYNAHTLLPAAKEIGREALSFGLTYLSSPIVEVAVKSRLLLDYKAKS